MSEALDILLIESHPGVGDTSAEVLAESGHRVHRCHEGGDPDWVCVGLKDPSSCPLEGHIDAAVLARAPGTIGRTDLEDGVRCAIRAGVPLVSVGTSERDGAPWGDKSSGKTGDTSGDTTGDTTGDTSGEYRPWVTLHSHERTLDAACRTAVTMAHQPMVDAVLERVAPLVAAAGLTADLTRCTISSRWPDITVTVIVPGPTDTRLDQAIGVRANDAIRRHAADHSTVTVKVLADTAEHLFA